MLLNVNVWSRRWFSSTGNGNARDADLARCTGLDGIMARTLNNRNWWKLERGVDVWGVKCYHFVFLRINLEKIWVYHQGGGVRGCNTCQNVMRVHR